MKTILRKFAVKGEIGEIIPIESGHINHSYHAVNLDPTAPDYFLQRINKEVFQNIPGLTNNVVKVVDAMLREQKKTANPQKAGFFPQPVQTHDKQYYQVDKLGNFWRVFTYIKNSRTYDIAEYEDLAMEGGKAVGKFQKYMLTVDPKGLHLTIPRFHDLDFRLDNFDCALNSATASRKGEAAEVIDFVQQRRAAMKDYFQKLHSGNIPLRVTHNDTKFNNILFDEHDFAICMIDLDTVMPGFIHYDFGDAIRVLCNTAAEDEADQSKIQFNPELFRSFAFGYSVYAKEFLTKEEIALIPLSPWLMTYIIAVRFLTDYLENDRYYKIQYPAHNLVRAKAQMSYIKQMDLYLEEINNCIAEYFGS